MSHYRIFHIVLSAAVAVLVSYFTLCLLAGNVTCLSPSLFHR